MVLDVIVVIIIGVLSFNFRSKQKDKLKQQQQQQQARIEQEAQEKARAERKLIEQRKEKIRHQTEIVQAERKHREELAKKEEKNQPNKAAVEQVSSAPIQHTQSKKQANHADFQFQLNYVYEEKLNAIFVVFENKADLQDCRDIIHSSKGNAHDAQQSMKKHKQMMEKQLGLSQNVALYLLPICTDKNHLDDVAEKVLSNTDKMLGDALIKLDTDALKSQQVTQLTGDKSLDNDVQDMLAKINYFVRREIIIVYFKNEEIATQTFEELFDTLEQAAHFCEIMQKVRQKIEQQYQMADKLQLWLMPGAADNNEQAETLMDALLANEPDPFSKYLLVLDTDGTISDGILTRNLPQELLTNEIDLQAVNTQNVRGNEIVDDNTSGDFSVYEWFIKETGEVFYVGMGITGKPVLDKNELFAQVREKFPSDYRFVAQNLTQDLAGKLRDKTIKVNLSAGNVLTNVQVPIGYTGARSSAAEKESYGARKFHYMETPKIVGNVVEEHYGLLETAETYDAVDLASLKKTVVPKYSLGLVHKLYFKDGQKGNATELIEKLKHEIQERTDAKIYKSIAKSASSVILTNDPFPGRVKELHDKGYKVFHMVDVIKFLGIDLDEVMNAEV